MSDHAPPDCPVTATTLELALIRRDQKMQRTVRDEVTTAIERHEIREMEVIKEFATEIKGFTEKLADLEGWRNRALGAIALLAALEPIILIVLNHRL